MPKVPPLRFPKCVKIENSRLSVFFYSSILGAAGFVAYNFWTSRAWLIAKVPNGVAHPRALNWFGAMADEDAKRANVVDGVRGFCTESSKYDYCSDEDCTWYFRGMQCLDTCVEGSVGSCLDRSERWMKEGNGLFFPTYFNETMTILSQGTAQDSSSAIRTVTTGQYFIKGVEDLVLTFDHEYFVESPLGGQERGSSGATSTEAYTNGMLTVLRDKNEVEISRWQPGTEVTLSLRTIFEQCGISLDSLNEYVGKNFAEGAGFLDGVSMRISGFHIDVGLNYLNPRQHDLSWDGPVCFITLHATNPWTYLPDLQVVDVVGSTRFRYYYGVRVQFSVTGSFGWVNMDALIQAITSVLVFIEVAKKIVFYFAIFGLGHLSKVYRRVVYQQVKLQRECYGLAARLVSHSSAFKELQDTPGGISESRLHQRFKGIFSHTEALDEAEISRFSKFVYDHMSHGGKDPAVDMEEYAMACSTNENLDFEALVGIFDANRKKSCLERFFADGTVRALFQDDKAMVAKAEKENEGQDPEVPTSLTGAPGARSSVKSVASAHVWSPRNSRDTSPRDSRKAAIPVEPAGNLLEKTNALLEAELNTLRSENSSLTEQVAKLQAQGEAFQTEMEHLREWCHTLQKDVCYLQGKEAVQREKQKDTAKEREDAERSRHRQDQTFRIVKQLGERVKELENRPRPEKILSSGPAFKCFAEAPHC